MVWNGTFSGLVSWSIGIPSVWLPHALRAASSNGSGHGNAEGVLGNSKRLLLTSSASGCDTNFSRGEPAGTSLRKEFITLLETVLAASSYSDERKGKESTNAGRSHTSRADTHGQKMRLLEP